MHIAGILMHRLVNRTLKLLLLANTSDPGQLEAPCGNVPSLHQARCGGSNFSEWFLKQKNHHFYVFCQFLSADGALETFIPGDFFFFLIPGEKDPGFVPSTNAEDKFDQFVQFLKILFSKYCYRTIYCLRNVAKNK